MPLLAHPVVTKHLLSFFCRKPGRFCLRTSWNAFHLVLMWAGSWSHLAIQKPAAPDQPHAHTRTPTSPRTGPFPSLSGPCFKTFRQKVQMLPHFCLSTFHLQTPPISLKPLLDEASSLGPVFSLPRGVARSPLKSG